MSWKVLKLRNEKERLGVDGTILYNSWFKEIWILLLSNIAPSSFEFSDDIGFTLKYEYEYCKKELANLYDFLLTLELRQNGIWELNKLNAQLKL